MFQANQKSPDKSDLYEDGKYVVLDDTFMQKEDYWYEDIKTDILILEEKYKGIVVGQTIGDFAKKKKLYMKKRVKDL